MYSTYGDSRRHIFAPPYMCPHFAREALQPLPFDISILGITVFCSLFEPRNFHKSCAILFTLFSYFLLLLAFPQQYITLCLKVLPVLRSEGDDLLTRYANKLGEEHFYIHGILLLPARDIP